MAVYSSKNRSASWELRVQWGSLIVAVVFVQFFYQVWVYPKVAAATQSALAAIDNKTGGDVERSVWIIIKDFEQQICFILVLWALLIIGFKLYQLAFQQKALAKVWVPIDTGERITPEQAGVHAKVLVADTQASASWLGALLPGVLLVALRRFQASGSIQETSAAVQELADAEGERLDADLSLIRYLAWAIPSVGFIGTVRGIGGALKQADQAIQGDIEGVTRALGLAFNSTLVALLLSIVLMYFIHLLQQRQESFILKAKAYCREHLIDAMKTPVD